MSQVKWILPLVAVGTLAQATAAQETATYTYDALGRLTASAYSGGPRAGKQAGLGYDPAGNRTNYNYGTPSSGGSGANLQAVSSTEQLGGSATYTFQPSKFASGGTAPLQIQSFTIPAGGGSRVIAQGGTSVSYTTPSANVGIDVCSQGADKIFAISVVTVDATNATVTATYTVVIPGRFGTTSPCL